MRSLCTRLHKSRLRWGPNSIPAGRWEASQRGGAPRRPQSVSRLARRPGHGGGLVSSEGSLVGLEPGRCRPRPNHRGHARDARIGRGAWSLGPLPMVGGRVGRRGGRVPGARSSQVRTPSGARAVRPAHRRVPGARSSQVRTPSGARAVRPAHRRSTARRSGWDAGPNVGERRGEVSGPNAPRLLPHSGVEECGPMKSPWSCWRNWPPETTAARVRRPQIARAGRPLFAFRFVLFFLLWFFGLKFQIVESLLSWRFIQHF